MPPNEARSVAIRARPSASAPDCSRFCASARSAAAWTCNARDLTVDPAAAGEPGAVAAGGTVAALAGAALGPAARAGPVAFGVGAAGVGGGGAVGVAAAEEFVAGGGMSTGAAGGAEGTLAFGSLPVPPLSATSRPCSIHQTPADPKPRTTTAAPARARVRPLMPGRERVAAGVDVQVAGTAGDGRSGIGPTEPEAAFAFASASRRDDAMAVAESGAFGTYASTVSKSEAAAVPPDGEDSGGGTGGGIGATRDAPDAGTMTVGAAPESNCGADSREGPASNAPDSGAGGADGTGVVPERYADRGRRGWPRRLRLAFGMAGVRTWFAVGHAAGTGIGSASTPKVGTLTATVCCEPACMCGAQVRGVGCVVWVASAATTRPTSRSRFSRCRSAWRSRADW